MHVFTLSSNKSSMCSSDILRHVLILYLIILILEFSSITLLRAGYFYQAISIERGQPISWLPLWVAIGFFCMLIDR